jgi:hypothetical protein
MKLENGDIFMAKEPLQKLLEQKLPVMISYKLAKMVGKLNEQYKVIEEVRQGLVKKYGTADEKNRLTVNPDSPNWDKFMSEFAELMGQEVEIVTEKVKLPEIVDGKPLEIEARVLMALDKFVEV